jgi:Glyoxalase-like domain
VSQVDRQLPRVRQAVLVARQLEPVVASLREELGLGEPFSDPGVEYFGLRNAVFALGETFLEVVSPVREDTAAGRLLDRRGGDCGYMVMFQVSDLAAARERAAARRVREVFEVELEDMAEVHLHPGDMRAAIVSLSAPEPSQSWRWGGPAWAQRSVPLPVGQVKLAVTDPVAVAELWSGVLGTPLGSAGVVLTRNDVELGLVEITLTTEGADRRDPITIGGIRFVLASNEEEQ